MTSLPNTRQCRKKERLGQRLRPFVLPLLAVALLAMGWRVWSLGRQLQDKHDTAATQAQVAKMQLETAKRESESWQVRAHVGGWHRSYLGRRQ